MFFRIISLFLLFFPFLLLASTRDSKCAGTVLNLTFDLNKFKTQAAEVARHLGYPPDLVQYIAHGGDKVIFRAAPPGKQAIGIAFPILDKGKDRVRWEATVTDSEIKVTENEFRIVSKIKGVKGYVLLPQSNVIIWEWSLSTLRDSHQEFYQISQADPVKFMETIAGFAESIEAMHLGTNRPPLLHRDIKLDNVHVIKPPGGETELRLSDFGLAAVKSPKDGDWKMAAGQDAGYGTPLYLNPERLDGKVSAVDDIRPFGLMLTELLTGKRIDELKPGNTYIAGYIGTRITKIRIPLSEIEPKAPKDLALVADYATHLAASMREVRELIGRAMKIRLDNKNQGKSEVDFNQHFFKKALTSKLKSQDADTIFFVFRSKEMIEEFIKTSDLNKEEKQKILQFMEENIKSGRLSDTKLEGVQFHHNNPYYNVAEFELAKKALKPRGFFGWF